MTSLVRYAGFDPDEDDFDGIELAPLHAEEIKPRREIKTKVDLGKVRQLRALGRGWDDIGRHLARDEGRRVPYRGNSIWQALRYGAEPIAAAREVIGG